MKKFITESELKNRVSSLREYMDSISEQPATAAAPDARAQYDQFKADDAKKAAIDRVKQYASIPLNQIPRLANAIDPKTGIIYYGDAGNEAGQVSPKKMPIQFMSQADQKPMLDALTAAGLKVVPTPKGQGFFGEPGGYAMVDPTSLAALSSTAPSTDAERADAAKVDAQAQTAPAKEPEADAAKVDAEKEQGAKTEPEATAPASPTEYVVKPGDNLTKIAQANGIADWKEIYNLNKDVIKNPNLIYPNQKLKMPAKPAAAGATTGAAAPATQTAQATTDKRSPEEIKASQDLGGFMGEQSGYDEIDRLVSLVHYR